MLAPKSGKEIRKDMKHGVEWSAEKTREAARKAADFAKEEASWVNKTISEKMSDLKRNWNDEKDGINYPAN